MNMLRPSVNQLITKNESSYSLVIGVAKRAREIADELYENGKTLEEKPVKTAIRELAAGKYRIVDNFEEPAQNHSVNGKTSGIAENLVRRRGSLCGFLYV